MTAHVGTSKVIRLYVRMFRLQQIKWWFEIVVNTTTRKSNWKGSWIPPYVNKYLWKWWTSSYVNQNYGNRDKYHHTLLTADIMMYTTITMLIHKICQKHREQIQKWVKHGNPVMADWFRMLTITSSTDWFI